MLNLVIAPMLKENLIANMRIHPFSVSIDGSNDTGLEKMNPLMVRIYDTNRNRVVTQFLDMCTSSSSTAENLYTTFDTKLQELLENANPWGLCTSVGVDNTSVNIGVRDSIKTRVLGRNSSIFFSGCPCHILHNAAQKSGDAFRNSCSFDVEEFTIDLYYWFDKSTKRKNTLQSYCSFCDQDYRSIIKHISTRWLSLHRAIERSLMQFTSLKSYFLSSEESQARFKRLKEIFEDPTTEIYLMFFHSVLPTFTITNKFLQREEPLIHVLQPQLFGLFKTVLSKFVKPAVIAEALKNSSLLTVDFKDPNNQLENEKLVVGFLTKQKAQQLLDEGEISESKFSSLFSAARKFFVCATDYLLKWCPMEEELLKHATWIDFDSRMDKGFCSVEYFTYRYPIFFTSLDRDKLHEQFVSYQLLADSDIPESVKEKSGSDVNGYYRIDDLWGYLKDVKKPGSVSSRHSCKGGQNRVLKM